MIDLPGITKVALRDSD